MGDNAGPQTNVVLGMCYHPPDQNAQNDLEMENENREVSKRGSVVIMGDFNYHHIDWINSYSSHDKEAKFLDVLNECALVQLVMELTRGEATLDLILSGAAQDLR